MTEWSQLHLPAALNNSAVKQRLVRAGTTKLGDAFRVTRGNIFARGLVGLVSTPEVQVQILPKTTGAEDHERGLRLLADMLRLELGLATNVTVGASGAHRDSLLEIVIGGVARTLSTELSTGVPRRYFPAVEDLQTIRGRVDLDHQARVPPGAALSVRVRHAPLQPDNELTRLLRALALTLLDRTHSVENRAQLMSCLDALRGVKPCALSEALIDGAETNRFESRWQWAVDLARLLASGGAPDPVRAGQSAGLTLLFQLHGLFERVLRKRLGKGLQGDLSLRPTKSIGPLLLRPADGAQLLSLEPDLLIDRRGSLVLIGDSKWKRSPAGEALRDDAYQLVTYLTRGGIKTGFLVYPSSEAIPNVCEVERYEVANVDLAIFVTKVDPERLCSARSEDVSLTCTALRDAVLAMGAYAPPKEPFSRLREGPWRPSPRSALGV